MTDETKTQDNDATLYSHHIFIFPFKWLSSSLEAPLEEQTNLATIGRAFATNQNWSETPYSINTPVKFNEYNYFYDYVREILYDTYKDRQNQSPLHKKEAGTEQLLRHFHLKTSPGEATYQIWINEDSVDKDCDYHLEVDSIILQLYNTGVGILSFHLHNRLEGQSTPQDILNINQFGRRLFPPFFSIPKHLTGTKDLDQFKAFKGNLPSGSEIAAKIKLDIPKLDISATEQWKNYETYDNFQAGPFQLPAFIKELLPKPLEKNRSESSNLNIVPALDDRMFVICWYGDNELASIMYQEAKLRRSRKGRRKEPAKLSYLLDEWWYKFVFVDAQNMTCQNEFMQEKLVAEATNGRWARWGTLYGASDYSFVMLSSDIKTLGNAGFQVTHLQTIYYKLAELVLLQRASVQRFSDEVTHISRLDADDEKLPEKVSSLYRQYIRFVNKIYFREVTAQTQGIELYQLLQKQARLEKQVKDLDDEINELHNYVLQTTEQKRLEQEKKLVEAESTRNRKLESLTLLGSIFIPPSILLAFYGVSILGEVHQPCLQHLLWALFGTMVLISWLAYMTYKSESAAWKFALGLVLLVSLSSPAWIGPWVTCPPPPNSSDKELPQINKNLDQINTKLINTLTPPIPVVIDTTKSLENE